jgi:hypothetical protein
LCSITFFRTSCRLWDYAGKHGTARQVGLNGTEIIASTGINTRTVERVASRHTGCQTLYGRN